jgi:chemosensory pili system protein ChpA (sensor histidine kinase/response regulator)
MSAEFDQDDLISVFVAEASDGMAAIARVLNQADDALPTPPQIQEHFITAHRIRGAAALYGYGGVAALFERLEAMCERAADIPDDAWPRAVGVMREMVQGGQTLVHAIGVGAGEDQATVDRCLAVSEEWASGDAVSEARVVPILESPVSVTEGAFHTDQEEGDPNLTVEYVMPPIDAEVLLHFQPEAEEYLSAMDGLIQVLFTNRDDTDAIYRLFRATRAFKDSACTVGFQVIGDVASPLVDCLLAVQEGHVPLSDERLDACAQAAALLRVLLRRDPSAGKYARHQVPAVISMLTELCGRQVQGLPASHCSEPTATQEAVPGTVPLESETGHPSALTDEYFLPTIDPEVLSYFVPETQEYLESLEANLLQLDKHPRNKDLIHQLFRTAHTLKGSAYTVGFQVIGDLVHHVEDVMGAMREERLHVLPRHTDTILRSIDVVRVLMRSDPNTVQATRQRFQTSLSELKQLEMGDDAEASMTSGAAGGPLSRIEPHAGLGEEQGTKDKPSDGLLGDEREFVRVSHARLEQLMNLVGELVIGRGRLEQRLLALERLAEQVAASKTRLVDAVQSFADNHMFTAYTATSAQAEPSNSRSRGFGNFGTLELDKYDDFNILARRIGEVTADMTESMAQLTGSLRHAQDDMSQLQHLTRNMRDEIARTRMIPIGTPFTRFRRAIRDVARASNKEVALVTSGEHTQVDTGVVERLVDALVHLVRNAVYHGIELPADRVAKGKPATGTIYLHAAHRGNSILVEVEDDGVGVDLAKIREKAVAIGLAQPEQVHRMTDAEVLQFMFAPGFSTADTIGDQAGRGVGLDVVKQVVDGMNGHIEVESLPDVGTKFTLHLPVTLLITTALLVRAGADRFAIALSSIREVTVATGASLTKTEDRTLLSFGEEMIEVQSLRHLLRGESGGVDGIAPVVIVRTAAGPIGLAVDELLGRHEIVIKRLGALRLLEQSCFGGATIDPEGRVILVIDPSRFRIRPAGQPSVQTSGLQRTSQAGGTGTTKSADAGEPSILLIDDSLSVRKIVGKMLQSAGYLVDTAVDGEDGLRKASETRYRLIITDLEMPKSNGYEVVQALRGRPLTKQTPIAVMTTRAGEKHRQLAVDIGVNAYIAKPVDERALLQVVERWVGWNPAVST